MSKKAKQSASNNGLRLDIQKALEAPVRVKRDGASMPIDPYEAMLRQHVRKSLVEKSVSSMKFVLGEADKHKLIKEPPNRINGGVFVVPKNLPEHIERQIFDDPDYSAQKGVSMGRIFWLLLTVIDFERLKRCFNGR